MKITTRTRALTLAIAITLVFFTLQQVEFAEVLGIYVKFDFIELLIISVLMYLGSFWVMSFRIRGDRFLTVLLFPSLSIFILTLYTELIINSVLGSVGKILTQIVASIVIALVAYVLILTANILNIGFLEKIPLSQAGRAAHYVLTLVSSFLFFSIVFSNTLPVIIKLGIVVFVSYVFASIALWTIEITYNQRLLSAMAIAVMMGLFSFVLIIWPVGSEYVALSLSLIYYMALGIALEIREVLNSRIWLEYGFIYLVIVLILLIVSTWGINGRLI